jgi:hypothetical protein
VLVGLDAKAQYWAVSQIIEMRDSALWVVPEMFSEALLLLWIVQEVASAHQISICVLSKSLGKECAQTPFAFCRNH